MADPKVNVMGGFKGGAIITADRPVHLDPNNRLGPQSMVLTPAQTEALYYQLHQKKCQGE